MNIADWLRETTAGLTEAGIATARLDCLVLLEDATGKDRAWLLAHPEHELQGSALKKLSTKIAQRAKHIPLAYIRGKAEFYGREFTVNAHTLVPRPETETMIDLLQLICTRESDVLSWQEPKKQSHGKRRFPIIATPTGKASSIIHTDSGFKVVWNKTSVSRHSEHGGRASEPTELESVQTDPSLTLRTTKTNEIDSRLRGNDSNLTIIDVGTGSGAIAITAKLEHPEATVIATDIDEKCLQTAQENAAQLGADITLLPGNLLEAVGNGERRTKNGDSPFAFRDSSFHILLCNLPYVPDNFQINTAATHEPRHALFGGPDGLDLYRKLFAEIVANSWKPNYILTESLPPQHDQLAEIASSSGYRLTKTEDFIQQFEPHQ